MPAKRLSIPVIDKRLSVFITMPILEPSKSTGTIVPKKSQRSIRALAELQNQ
jgi:hypothetical protein